MTTIQRNQSTMRSWINNRKRFRYFFYLIIFVFITTGCRTEIISDVSEQEVGKILYELRIRGIDASSSETGKNLHKIQVSAEQSSEASQIAALIRPLLRDRSQEEKPPGFLSGPEQEKLYVTQQLAHQLEDSLRLLPSIVAARITIAFPSNEGTNEQEKKPANLGSASVLVISSTGADISRDSIAQFIANGTTISQERVLVIISELPKTGQTSTSSPQQQPQDVSKSALEQVDKTELSSVEHQSTISPQLPPSPKTIQEKLEIAQPTSPSLSGTTIHRESLLLIAIPIAATVIALLIGMLSVRRRRSHSLKAAYRKL